MVAWLHRLVDLNLLQTRSSTYLRLINASYKVKVIPAKYIDFKNFDMTVNLLACAMSGRVIAKLIENQFIFTSENNLNNDSRKKAPNCTDNSLNTREK